MSNKYKLKLIQKLEGFSTDPEVELIDKGIGKKAFVKKSFQVLGKTLNIEIGCKKKLELIGGQFYIDKDFYLIKFNSRSTEGGYTYFLIEDIASALDLTTDDIKNILHNLEEATKFGEKELEKAKSVYRKRMEKSEKKLEV